MIEIRAEGIRLRFEPQIGQIVDFTVEDGGRRVAPLHRAHWVASGEVLPDDIAPHLAALGGDFFCAPFAGSEGGSPMHGWTANSPWSVVAEGVGLLRAVLARPVFGATVLKELSLCDGHPFVYQRHVFVGGKGRVPVANHANVGLPQGGMIRTSPKRAWETPNDPQESDPARGRSALVYPAQAKEPRAFPGVSGPVDLTRFPWNPRHEDFAIGVEAQDALLGWTAVTRTGQGDLYLSLRNPRELPMTMLWHSNGGRDYPPWSGRHFGCLGVEEGAAEPMLGVSSAADLAGPGGLDLDPLGVAEVRHVIGAVAWPSEEPLAEARISGEAVELLGDAGTVRTVPLRADFLAL